MTTFSVLADPNLSYALQAGGVLLVLLFLRWKQTQHQKKTAHLPAPLTSASTWAITIMIPSLALFIVMLLLVSLLHLSPQNVFVLLVVLLGGLVWVLYRQGREGM